MGDRHRWRKASFVITSVEPLGYAAVVLVDLYAAKEM